MSKKRTIRFDKGTNERLEQMIIESGKSISVVIRDLVKTGKVEVITRIGDQGIQENLSRFHKDMNENYLHTNAQLEQVEKMISRLGEKAAANNKVSDLLYDVDMHLLQIRQNLRQYHQWVCEEASEIVNLQR